MKGLGMTVTVIPKIVGRKVFIFNVYDNKLKTVLQIVSEIK
jgi:hypothetical protein